MGCRHSSPSAVVTANKKSSIVAKLGSNKKQVAAEQEAPSSLTSNSIVADSSDGSGHVAPGFQVTDIHTACKVGDVDFVQRSIHDADLIRSKSPEGRSPLYLASLCGHTKVVKVLLEAGCKDEDGSAYLAALNDQTRQLLRPKKKRARQIQAKVHIMP